MSNSISRDGVFIPNITVEMLRNAPLEVVEELLASGEMKDISLPYVQSDIIRCKDCKHSEPWYRDKSRCFLWYEDGIDVFDDGFCNYAERRTDE